MSNKITGKDLGKMIKEALLNEVEGIDFDTFRSVYNKGNFNRTMSVDQRNSLNAKPRQFYDDLAVLDSDQSSISENDLDRLLDKDEDGNYVRLASLSTARESKLLALKYLFNTKSLEKDVSSLEAKLEKQKAKVPTGLSLSALLAKLENNATLQIEIEDLNEEKGSLDEIELRDKTAAALKTAKQTKDDAGDAEITIAYTNKQGESKSWTGAIKTIASSTGPLFKKRYYINVTQKEADRIEKVVKVTKEYREIQAAELVVLTKARDAATAAQNLSDAEDTINKQIQAKKKAIKNPYASAWRTAKDPVSKEKRAAVDGVVEILKNIKSKKNKIASIQSAKTPAREKISKKAGEVLQTFYDLVTTTAKEKPQTAFGKAFTTAKGDFGVFKDEDEATVERVLGTSDSISDRILKISQISEKYYTAAIKPETIAVGSHSEFLAELQLLDMFASVIKDYDSGAGAYLFEYLLALITLGSVAGKEKTVYGQMGAADFIYEKGTASNRQKVYGSSKFVKDGKSEQSIKGFKDIFEKNGGKSIFVEYVITAKKSDFQSLEIDSDGVSQAAKRGLTSDPAKMLGISTWVPMIEYDGSSFKHNGKNLETSGDKLLLNVKDFGNPIGTIKLATVRTETFREMLEKSISDKNDDLKKVFKLFRDYMKQIDDAESNARLYSVSKNRDKAKAYGEQTFKNINKSEKLFAELVEEMDDGHTVNYPDDGTSPVADNITLSEKLGGQKITSNLLKKIIKETLKK